MISTVKHSKYKNSKSIKRERIWFSPCTVSADQIDDEQSDKRKIWIKDKLYKNKLEPLRNKNVRSKVVMKCMNYQHINQSALVRAEDRGISNSVQFTNLSFHVYKLWCLLYTLQAYIYKVHKWLNVIFWPSIKRCLTLVPTDGLEDESNSSLELISWIKNKIFLPNISPRSYKPRCSI